MSSPLTFPVGDGTWTVDVPADKRVPVVRTESSEPTASPRELVRAALESPIGLNVPLHKALTPDDRVAVVLDERLPHLGELLAEVLSHLHGGGVEAAAVSVVVPPSESQPWIDDLPDELDDIHVEVHDPTDVRKVAFLGMSSTGRKVYLNRTLVEADFVVVLSGRRFAAWGGLDGAEGSIFPALSNAETLGGVSTAATRKEEAEAVAYMLGTPCFVQIIEGPGDTVAEVVAGIGTASKEGRKRQKARWACQVDEKADLVIVGAGGSRIKWADILTAAANGLKCLADDGRLVILTDLPEDQIADRPPWADDDASVTVFVGAEWDEERYGSLDIGHHLGSERELARLIAAAERVVVLPDAYKVRVQVG